MSTESKGSAFGSGRFGNDLDPIIWDDHEDLIASVEEFLRQQAAEEPAFRVVDPLRYRLAEAPPALIRRFLLRPPSRPEDGASWIAWRELGDHYARVSAADECRRLLSQEHQFNHDLAQGTLTADVVWEVYEDCRPILCNSRGRAVDFDLHDVFVCTEAELLELQAQYGSAASGELMPDVWVAPQRAEAFRRSAMEAADLLGVVGQAIG